MVIVVYEYGNLSNQYHYTGRDNPILSPSNPSSVMNLSIASAVIE